MQKWEYCTLGITAAKGDEPASVIINKAGEVETITSEGDELPRAPIGELGREGWEAVGIATSPVGQILYLFKRPIED